MPHILFSYSTCPESYRKPIQTLWDTFDHKAMSLLTAQYYYGSLEFEMGDGFGRECLDSQL